MRCPWMPPCAFTASNTSCAPWSASPTVAATVPVMPTVCPTRICAFAPDPKSNPATKAQSERGNTRMSKLLVWVQALAGMPGNERAVYDDVMNYY